jgi:hypothetical protein
MWELEAQDHQGDQHTVTQDQTMVGAGAGGAPAWVAAALLEAAWWAAVHGSASSVSRSARCYRDSPVKTGGERAARAHAGVDTHCNDLVVVVVARV